MSSSKSEIKYIYHLPFNPYSKLCEILNQNDRWEELAGSWMHFDLLTIQRLRNEKNPSKELLEMWSHYNHTILELFILLSRTKQFQGMMLLKPFVEKKYHALIQHCDENFNKLSEEQIAGVKIMQIGKENFNQGDGPVKDIPKILIQRCSTESQRKIVNKSPIGEPVSNSNNLLIASLEASNLPALPKVSFDELERATDNWNEKNILGRGGFGTVYKGVWMNTQVAVKRIECRRSEVDETFAIQLEQSCREIKILNSRAHDNILPIYAYSMGGQIPCLVYQFMQNRSLEDRLSSKYKDLSLTWLQRYEIAKGIARGLQYLHSIGDRPLIHGDIKTANILLDKNLEAKIGDFGLAREGIRQSSMIVSKIHGTKPYLPPEFLREAKLSTKVDTYSYGIVLFEMATGLASYDRLRKEKKFLKDYVESFEMEKLILLVDERAGDEWKSEVFHNFIVLGKNCSSKLAKNRPEMDVVYTMLNECNNA